MKKSLISLMLIPTLFIGACKINDNRVGADHFKEYTFSGVATAKQINEITSGLEKNCVSLSSIHSKHTSYSKSGSQEAKASEERTATVYEDSNKPDNLIMISLIKSKTDQTNGGITIHVDTQQETKSWDGGSGFRFNSSKITSNGQTEENVSAYELGETKSADFKENSIKSLISYSFTGMTCYLNSDGSFTYIASSVTKSVSAVAWGNGTKEYITSSKQQTVYSISKNYFLTNNYFYSETKANRDPVTGEWYKSEQLISNSYSTVDYKYEKRENKTISSLNETIKDKEFVLSASVKSYDVAATYSGSQYTVNESNPTENTISVYRTSAAGVMPATYQFTSSIQPRISTNVYHAQRYEFITRTLKGATNVTTNTYKIGNLNQLNPVPTTVSTSNGMYIVNDDISYYTKSITFNISFNGQNAIITSASGY